MKEEDINKAIQLKEQIDSKRELLQFADIHTVDLRVNLENICNNEIRNVNYLLNNDVIKGLRAMVIASLEKNINDLQEELEKL